jgi:hypothetical protein
MAKSLHAPHSFLASCDAPKIGGGCGGCPKLCISTFSQKNAKLFFSDNLDPATQSISRLIIETNISAFNQLFRKSINKSININPSNNK